MIPTKTRNKLPRFLCYPVGAKVVTDALTTVPQIEQLELWFIQNKYGESEVDRRRLVVSARFSKHNLGVSASHAMDELGLYGPKWDVWIYAVPKELNATIRSALVGHGFGLIRDWLSQRRTELWRTTSHRCELWYSLDEERLIAKLVNS